jgi:hypothetical protein
MNIFKDKKGKDKREKMHPEEPLVDTTSERKKR